MPGDSASSGSDWADRGDRAQANQHTVIISLCVSVYALWELLLVEVIKLYDETAV